MIENWCYGMCDSVILPIVTIITFFWTIYQEKKIRGLQNEAL